jgi:hypothetical protein
VTPILTGATFEPTGARIALAFAAPTNRAGLVGSEPCSKVLAAGTMALIRGGGSSEPLCSWSADGMTLYATLNRLSAVRPGSTLELAAGKIGPVELPASGCASSPLCPSDTATIPASAPCGAVGCETPVVLLSGPATLSSCDDATLTLVAQASSGAGTLPLAYAFGVDDSSNNSVALREWLSSSSAFVSNTSVFVPASLLANVTNLSSIVPFSDFAFTLTATSLLGPVSAPATFRVARGQVATPYLIIEGLSMRAVRGDRVVTARAVAEPATCNVGRGAIDFKWELVGVTGLVAACNTSTLPASIGPELLKPFLSLPAGALKGGCTYTLEVPRARATRRAPRAAHRACALSRCCVRA